MSIPRITEILEYFGKGKVDLTASGSSAIQYTKAEKNKDWRSIAITNDGLEDLRVVVDGKTIVVKPREQFDDNFEQFKTVQILDNISYRLILRK